MIITNNKKCIYMLNYEKKNLTDNVAFLHHFKVICNPTLC